MKPGEGEEADQSSSAEGEGEDGDLGSAGLVLPPDDAVGTALLVAIDECSQLGANGVHEQLAAQIGAGVSAVLAALQRLPERIGVGGVPRLVCALELDDAVVGGSLGADGTRCAFEETEDRFDFGSSIAIRLEEVVVAGDLVPAKAGLLIGDQTAGELGLGEPAV